MHLIRSAIVGILTLLAVASANAQQFPTVPAQSVIGRLGIPGQSGPSQAIPLSIFNQSVLSSLCQTDRAFPVYNAATISWVCSVAPAANFVYAGPSTGAAAQPTFRALVGADLPLPAAATLGGVKSLAPVTSNWINSIGTNGSPTQTQPAFSDISGSFTLAQFPTIATLTALCNVTGGSAVPTACSKTQLTSLINVATASLSGALPAFPNNTTTFFRGDGSYQTLNCAALSGVGVGCSAATGQLPGEPSTGSASAGNVGEVISGDVPAGSVFSVTSATPKTITSINLTAGDWIVDGMVGTNPAASTSITAISGYLSLVTNTADQTVGRSAQSIFAAVVPGGGAAQTVSIAPVRFSLSVTTTIFLVGSCTFTVSTNNMWGHIEARRVR